MVDWGAKARRWVIAGAVVAACVPREGWAQGVPERRFTVSDLLSLEVISSATMSPDGQWIAVVVSRPRRAGERYQQVPVANLGATRGDVWLIRSDGRERRRLTDGRKDGSGYWDPVWSPDGKALAMLSTRGGDGVHVYVWQRSTGRLERMSERNVDLMASTSAAGGNWVFDPLMWLSQDSLLVPVVPSGHHPYLYDVTLNGPRAQASAWRMAETGERVTASVLDSRQDELQRAVGQGDLLLVDLRAHRAVSVAKIPMDETSKGVRYFVLSPHRDVAAVVSTVVEAPDPSKPLRRSAARNRLGIVDVTGRTPPRWMDELDVMVDLQFRHVIRWSPSGRMLAVLARRSGTDTTLRLFSVSVRGGEVTPLLQDGWKAVRHVLHGGELLLSKASLVWTSADEPVVLGRPSVAAARDDWWLRRGGHWRNLSGALAAVPQALVRTSRRDVFVGAAGGSLWEIDANSGDARQVPEERGRVNSIVWPAQDDAPAVATGQVLISTGAESSMELWVVDLSAEHAKSARLAQGAAASGLLGYSPAARIGLFEITNRRLFTVSERDQQPTVILEVNEALDRVELPHRVLISYRGLDGQPLHGVLVLPVGGHPGGRYPAIVDVYPGQSFADTNDVSVSPFDPGYLNPLILAAHGYAVLFPDMPLAPWGATGEPLLEIPKGVLPAVEAAASAGLIDPDRVGVMGVSYGGYATDALVTQTHMFRAAVSFAGPTDLLSMYGTFWAQNRERADAHLPLANPYRLEGGQGRMGGPPSTNLWRYLLNSPISYVEQVDTPIMLIHGDLDFVGIEQAEEFFTALYRLGKRARFVRYWGEAHGIESPANIQDMWKRIFDWFDHYLGVASETAELPLDGGGSNQ